MMDEKSPLSAPMRSALQAVARLRGNSTIDWSALLDESMPDDRVAPLPDDSSQQGWKPAGR